MVRLRGEAGGLPSAPCSRWLPQYRRHRPAAPPTPPTIPPTTVPTPGKIAVPNRRGDCGMRRPLHDGAMPGGHGRAVLRGHQVEPPGHSRHGAVRHTRPAQGPRRAAWRRRSSARGVHRSATPHRGRGRDRRARAGRAAPRIAVHRAAENGRCLRTRGRSVDDLIGRNRHLRLWWNRSQ